MEFNIISRECNIRNRILSKELLELEQNGLVNREFCDTKPVTVGYSLIEYSKTLDKLIIEMQNWDWLIEHMLRICNSKISYIVLCRYRFL